MMLRTVRTIEDSILGRIEYSTKIGEEMLLHHFKIVAELVAAPNDHENLAHLLKVIESFSRRT